MALQGLTSQQHRPQSDCRLTRTSGVAYKLRYVGCIPVRVSIKSVGLELRTKIAHACIRWVCEQAGLRQSSEDRDEYRPLTAFVGQVADRNWSMTDVHFTVTSHALTVESFDVNWLMFHHDLCRVSFASSGDSECSDFVCYVAKNAQGKRICYVFECPQGAVQEVMIAFSQAFQLGYQDFKRARLPASTGRASSPPNDFRHPNGSHGIANRLHQTPSDSVSGNGNPLLFPMECGPPGSLSIPHCHMSPFANHLHRTNRCVSPSEMNMKLGAPPKEPPPPLPADAADLVDFSDDVCLLRNEITHRPGTYNRLPSIPHQLLSPRQRPTSTALAKMSPVDPGRLATLEPIGEPWYVGKMSRPQAEALLRYEGDFLVRASPQQAGQFVLSGMRGGKHRHLLLVDPQGKVRTRERVFDSIQHLIDFHVQTGNPICSTDSELRLVFPVSGQTFP